MSENVWYVYIIRCANGSLYTGVTKDINRRFAEHKSGKGAKYTRANKAEKIVYSEICSSRSEACKREVAIKKMDRSEKDLLIKN